MKWTPTAHDILDSCPLCEGKEFEVVATEDRYGFTQPACQCDSCCHIFLNPRPSAESYAEFYQEVYRPLVSEYHGRKIDAKTIQREQMEYADSVYEFIRPLDRGGTLLDIGGSTGVVAHKIAKAFGLSATVLDPSPDELKYARLAGLDTLEGTIESVELADASFDIILMCQTIDHILDPIGAMQKIEAALKPGGVVFVDAVDLAMTNEIKIDHPQNFTFPTFTYLVTSDFDVEKFERADVHMRYLLRK